MEKRSALIISAILLTALVAVVNAAAFAYRWMQATVSVAEPTQATGAACVGFYSSAAQSGISPTYLPSAGTNYQATTYGDNKISVTPGNVVCQWTSPSGYTYSLYESITVSLPLTVGSWYIKDLYGFGYNATTGSQAVYVWIKVETAVSGAQTAKLILYKAGTNTKVAELDLTTSSTASVTLDPGEALQIDLLFDTDNAGTYSFKVGFYASQQSAESPR